MVLFVNANLWLRIPLVFYCANCESMYLIIVIEIFLLLDWLPCGHLALPLRS